jgi:TPR repeat protein
MRLGAHLANGTGVPGDAAQAYFWWLLAAPHDAEARAFAERIRPTLDLAQVADAERRAQGWQPRRERPPGEGCMALP